jgi:hypothetical protein
MTLWKKSSTGLFFTAAFFFPPGSPTSHSSSFSIHEKIHFTRCVVVWFRFGGVGC